jgi:hypothetical protein
MGIGRWSVVEGQGLAYSDLVRANAATDNEEKNTDILVELYA